MEQLTDIRRRGYHITYQENQWGAWGLGAPIFDSQGKTQAALVIAGVLSEEKPQVAVLKKFLLEATRDISKSLAISSGRTRSGKTPVTLFA